MPPKKIHEDFTETRGMVSPYSTVKKLASEFKTERESIEDDGRSGHTKDTAAHKMLRSCTPGLCVIGGEICDV